MTRTTAKEQTHDECNIFTRGNLVISKGGDFIVLVHCGFSGTGNSFSGTVLHHASNHDCVGLYQSTFDKINYKQFYGEVNLYYDK